MKTRIIPGWLFGIVVAVAGAASGFAQNAPGAPVATSPSDAVAAAASRPATNPIAQPSLAAPTAQAKHEDQTPLPPTTLSSWSREIQKLAQASVDERVITSYITNCAGLFNLTADDIIYLKKAGVSPRIVSVMLQHDQKLFPAAGPVAALAPPSADSAAKSRAPADAPVLASDEPWVQDSLFLDDAYFAPEQPEGLGPVRAPYAVKLNDPIIMLRLPAFTVPCW